ncbi:hypothetical protein OB920_08385 [Halobacteria archaeon HArc-gm2]|nr:hypothetical protein [Halobacteria archaeon HArc-gm2]
MIGHYYEQSKVHSVVQRLGDAGTNLDDAYHRSVLGRSVDRLAEITRQSYLFRWLTAEPDPDVIVIDLRETWTVGPVIAVLDWFAPHAARSWDGSVVRTTTERTATAFRAAPVQLTSALLLGVLAIQFVLSWNSASDTTLAGLCFLAAFAIVGLRVDWTWDELVESKIGKLATALLVPPDLPEDEN